MTPVRQGGKKGRKIGRAFRSQKLERWKRRSMTMGGMMGRKVRALMRHNGYTREQAEKHWRANRRRGLRP